MKQTRIKQLLGSRSLCRHKAGCSHYPCILKQLTLHTVLLVFVSSGKKIQTCFSQFKNPFVPGNVTFSGQRLRKGTREVTEKSGGQEELFPQSSALIRSNADTQRQTCDRFPSASFLACGTRSADFLRKQKMNDAISSQPLHHKDKARFLFVCFSVCFLGRLGT